MTGVHVMVENVPQLGIVRKILGKNTRALRVARSSTRLKRRLRPGRYLGTALVVDIVGYLVLATE